MDYSQLLAMFQPSGGAAQPGQFGGNLNFGQMNPAFSQGFNIPQHGAGGGGGRGLGLGWSKPTGSGLSAMNAQPIGMGHLLAMLFPDLLTGR
jgi:hypothetical protein